MNVRELVEEFVRTGEIPEERLGYDCPWCCLDVLCPDCIIGILGSTIPPGKTMKCLRLKDSLASYEDISKKAFQLILTEFPFTDTFPTTEELLSNKKVQEFILKELNISPETLSQLTK